MPSAADAVDLGLKMILSVSEKETRKLEARARHYEKNGDQMRARARERMRAVRLNHPERVKEQKRKWNAANRGKGPRRYFLKKTYGMTLEQWDTLFASQNSCCVVCKRNEPSGGKWHTDHDHNTGVVRGILCSQCNVSIGMMRDSPVLLRQLADYVEKHKNGRSG